MRSCHRMRSAFVKLRCTALSSSFNAQHFCQVSMHSTFVKFQCTYMTRNELQHYRSCVRSACPACNLCLVSAACKTCNPGHILCSSFCLANYGFSSVRRRMFNFARSSERQKFSAGPSTCIVQQHRESRWAYRGPKSATRARIILFKWRSSKCMLHGPARTATRAWSLSF